MKNYTLKPIEFKFGDYLSEGFELFKKDIGGFVLAFFFSMIMSLIPFCGYLALGNFYKYCRKVKNGEQASASDIFNFDNFQPYFIIQLILMGAFLLVILPLSLLGGYLGDSGGSNRAALIGGIFTPLIIGFIVVILIITLKGFYVPALISLEGEKDWKTAWNISKVMSKGNLLMIFLFSLVISFIGQIGIILCGIGIFLTIPITYICTYIAYEDALNQIKKDEIAEIGNRTSF